MTALPITPPPARVATAPKASGPPPAPGEPGDFAALLDQTSARTAEAEGQQTRPALARRDDENADTSARPRRRDDDTPPADGDVPTAAAPAPAPVPTQAQDAPGDGGEAPQGSSGDVDHLEDTAAAPKPPAVASPAPGTPGAPVPTVPVLPPAAATPAAAPTAPHHHAHGPAGVPTPPVDPNAVPAPGAGASAPGGPLAIPAALIGGDVPGKKVTLPPVPDGMPHLSRDPIKSPMKLSPDALHGSTSITLTDGGGVTTTTNDGAGGQSPGQGQGQPQPGMPTPAPATPQPAAAPAPAVQAAPAAAAPAPVAPPVPAGAPQGAVPTPQLARTSLVQTADRVHELVRIATNRAGNARATLQLRPEALGRIDVHLRTTREGLVATIAAHDQAGLDALHGAAAELRRTLEDRGVQLHSLDLQMGSGDNGFSNQGDARQAQSGRGGSAPSYGLGDDEDVVDEDALTITTTTSIPAGALVDVTA